MILLRGHTLTYALMQHPKYKFNILLQNTSTEKLNVNPKYCDTALTYAACKIHITLSNTEYKYNIL